MGTLNGPMTMAGGLGTLGSLRGLFPDSNGTTSAPPPRRGVLGSVGVGLGSPTTSEGHRPFVPDLGAHATPYAPAGTSSLRSTPLLVTPALGPVGHTPPLGAFGGPSPALLSTGCVGESADRGRGGLTSRLPWTATGNRGMPPRRVRGEGRDPGDDVDGDDGALGMHGVHGVHALHTQHRGCHSKAEPFALKAEPLLCLGDSASASASPALCARGGGPPSTPSMTTAEGILHMAFASLCDSKDFATLGTVQGGGLGTAPGSPSCGPPSDSAQSPPSRALRDHRPPLSPPTILQTVLSPTRPSTAPFGGASLLRSSGMHHTRLHPPRGSPLASPSLLPQPGDVGGLSPLPGPRSPAIPGTSGGGVSPLMGVTVSGSMTTPHALGSVHEMMTGSGRNSRVGAPPGERSVTPLVAAAVPPSIAAEDENDADATRLLAVSSGKAAKRAAAAIGGFGALATAITRCSSPSRPSHSVDMQGVC